MLGAKTVSKTRRHGNDAPGEAPSDPAAPDGLRPETPAAMVDGVFDMLYTDGSCVLSFAEVRLLAEHTGGVAMTEEEHIGISQVDGFGAAEGIDRACLRKICLELDMGTIETDYPLVASRHRQEHVGADANRSQPSHATPVTATFAASTNDLGLVFAFPFIKELDPDGAAAAVPGLCVGMMLSEVALPSGRLVPNAQRLERCLPRGERAASRGGWHVRHCHVA